MGNQYTFDLRKEPDLGAKLRAFPYQQEAVEFVAERQYAAIFHEQGLGKTKIALDVILRWLSLKEVDTVIVFTKKSLIANWQREIKNHSHLSPLVLSEHSNKNYYVFTTPTRLVLAHYEVAKKEERRLAAWLGSRRAAVIIDEAAKIKNPAAQLTQAFFRLASRFRKRVIMTGTPVANRPYDVWAPIFFLDQGKTLGTNFSQFKRETDLTRNLHSDPAAYAAYQQNLERVHQKLTHISVRETKNGGRISLPAKEYNRIECVWEVQQHDLYSQVRNELRAVVLRNGKLIEDDQEVILKRLLRLVQIASNPLLVDESYKKEPGKFQPLYDLVTDICRGNEKAIVWTAFNANSEWLAKRLGAFGAHALNGRMPIDRRNAVVSWFIDNDQDRILVATPGAAKEGLTLTVANHVIFYDRSYSLDDYLQAQDRIHRVSQTRTCYVYNLIMQDSVDEWIDSLLEEKRLAAQLTQGDIDARMYADRATLSFFDIIQRILA